ncbi:right-handed parallel beta-helix repeat-containing protein [Horticoccus sp. 23ND18S-11]|uniref:right-handed parallel beta-helix repeat-containing protein n=1 Tax=Horticoccus sp. 23ND18S-11 TaxID=3391832 RepID=UPI0039C8F56B
MRLLSAALAAWSFVAPVEAATLYVSPTGEAGSAGTASSPLASLAEAARRAQPGDVIQLAGGTYRQDQPILLSAKGTADASIRIEPADAKRPVFDFSAQKFEQKLCGIVVAGDYWHIVGLEVVGAARFGIEVTGHHNVMERCVAHENQGSGFQLSAPASHNLILDCDSYRNVDRPARGENADGFGAKFAIGPGNIFRGCRAWENADDGYDLWKAPHAVRIEHCVASRNGLNLWGIDRFTGNGNGFKLGGDFVPAAHVVIGCIVMDQPKNGFDQNNNTAALTVKHCTAVRCGMGYSFTLKTASGEPHVFQDNIGWNAPAMFVEGTVMERNHWSSDHRPQIPAVMVESTPVTRQPLAPKRSTKKP